MKNARGIIFFKRKGLTTNAKLASLAVFVTHSVLLSHSCLPKISRMVASKGL